MNTMAYTEIKEKNGRRYFYRVISIRNGIKVSKKRLYLGKNLPSKLLKLTEANADKELVKRTKINKELIKIKPKILYVLKKYGVKQAGIFGSYARGDQKKNSDIDILIKPPNNMGLGFVGLQQELEEKLGKKVDLVSYNGLSPYLKKYILLGEVKIL